ncbi:hypothetical protein H5410_055920 [Solanum commersonii]|uniref:DUF4283 domain-containing protein n=1 Tax=Solanum commersonii TaxID=4109 RepID=A0A9J5WJS5_SOLCO|nr:hypothetical protein H5410_055920 [Solanum commersonii]
MASKKTRLQVKPPKIYKGKSAAFFTPQEEEESAKNYRFTIVGKMVTWTIDFNPEEETPLASIWITLLGLKWHYFN